MAQNTSSTNSLSTVTERKRLSAALSSSATIDDASVTYFMGRKKNVSIYDKYYKKFTKPTVCTDDCKLKIPLETIADCVAAILQLFLCLRIHSQAKNAVIWTWKVFVDEKWQKKKPYQKRGPTVNEGAQTAAAMKKKIYWKSKESMDKMDEELEKLYDDLEKLLDDLKEKISPESELYQPLTTRNQFWPSIRSLSGDPIIDELKEAIAEKTDIANTHGSMLTRCKNEMFQNCYKMYYGHGKELKDLINKLLNLMEKEAEPLQAKRQRLSEEEEIQNEVTRNIKICSRPVQSTPMLVEDILKELGMRLSSNLVPLTYEQFEQALGKDIRPILRKFLMDPMQTVDNTVRVLVQLSNNQFIQSRTLDTTFLPAALKEPKVWRTFIFDWLAERRTYFSAAMSVATMEEPQDEDLQTTSYDNGSICKTTDTPTAYASRSVPVANNGTDNDDYFLEGNLIPNPTGVQKEKSVDLSSNNPTIPPLPANEREKLSRSVNLDTTSCSNETASPPTKEVDALINWLKDDTREDRVPLPPSSTGDATVDCPSWSDVIDVLNLDTNKTVPSTRTPKHAIP